MAINRADQNWPTDETHEIPLSGPIAYHPEQAKVERYKTISEIVNEVLSKYDPYGKARK